MFKRIPSILFLFFTSIAFAQLDSNSVTVTSSKNTTLPADQAIFAIYVNSDTSTTINDVVAAVQSAGITLANFTGLGGQLLAVIQQTPQPQPPPPMLQWTFTLNVPLSKTKDTVATLTTLQQSLQKNTKLTLSFSIQGTQVSQQAQQSQTCVLTDLIADARMQAQNLAAAASRSVAGILSMSSLTSNTVGACTVTVKFALLGN